MAAAPRLAMGSVDSRTTRPPNPWMARETWNRTASRRRLSTQIETRLTRAPSCLWSQQTPALPVEWTPRMARMRVPRVLQVLRVLRGGGQGGRLA